MNAPLSLLSICMAVCSTDAFDQVIQNVITSLLTMDNKPTTLVLPEQMCWESKHYLRLSKKTMDAGITVTRTPQSPLHRRHELVFLADLECDDVKQLLMRGSKDERFNSPYRWILLRDGRNLTYHDDEEHQSLLRQLDVLVDSDVVVVDRVGENSFELIEVYKIASTWDLIHKHRGRWQNGVLEDLRSGVKSASRRNLHGHTLTMSNVVVDSNDTREHLGDRLDLRHDSITKMSWLAAKTCFDMLNATAKAVFTHTWGYRDKDGNWQGMINQLQHKEADLGTLSIFTKERSYIIDYIAMIGSTSVRFVFREPPLSYVSNIYTLPFSRGVWLGILVCVCSSAAVLYVASKWEASVDMHPQQLNGSWADVLILTISAIMQQGCVLEPRFGAGRILTFFLFVVLMALYAAYSANIVVLLRAPSSSVRTLPDLLRSPLTLGASDLEYNRYFFKKLNEPIRKEIYEKKIAPKGNKPHFYSMKEGVEKIRKGLFAFHMEVNPGYRLIQDTYQENEKCDLVEIDYINEFDPWLPAQKNSPYLELFKVSFRKYRETGLQQATHRWLQVPKPKCSGVVASFTSVGIIDTYPSLLMMLYGFLLALAVLIGEIALHKIQDRRRRFPFVN